MAQISKGDTFVDGQQVTGARLNQLVDSSTLLVGAITDQPSITPNTLEATDSTIVNDAGTLKEATIGDFLNSNLPITTSSITGGSGADIVITPSAGQKVDVAGNVEVNDIVVTGSSTTNGKPTFNSTEALKLPAGTTAQRPVTAVLGDLRFNSTTGLQEFYNGSDWVSINPLIKAAVATLVLPTNTYYNYQTANAWTSLPFNTLSQTDSFVVNSSSFTGTGTSNDQIVLPAGTYSISTSASIIGTDGFGTICVRVRNLTASTIINTGFVSNYYNYANGTSICHAVFKLTTQSIINIQYLTSIAPVSSNPVTNDLHPEVLFPTLITKLS